MATSSEAPKLRGKTIAVFTRNRPGLHPVVLSDCLFETRGERLFLVGTGIPAQTSTPEWTDGVRRSIAWDAVEEFLLFESPDDYYARQDAAPASSAPPEPALPMFELPQGSEGHPVEPSGIAMEPETPLDIGTVVLSFSQGRWWRAEVVGVDDEDQVTIHFPGWDSKWDLTVPKTELQVYLGDSIEMD